MKDFLNFLILSTIFGVLKALLEVEVTAFSWIVLGVCALGVVLTLGVEPLKDLYKIGAKQKVSEKIKIDDL